ncbi:hypothetical protein [Streptomyces sp. LS1784]|uniref:hypothetical protein n=1 Tax=Streptomyces sp. LS1784 TaxID=2851533 RepID=UPI001CC8F20D|nr:hypothetical protein [Streptomyces sp. LS1784]
MYATTSDYQAVTGQAPGADTERLLADASEMLDALVLRTACYQVDSTGMPTDPVVIEALRRATCRQVAWWGLVGDSTGASGAGWGSVSIGSVSLGRGAGSSGLPDGSDSAARQVAPQAWDALRSPDLTPDRMLFGSVFAP